jgi:oxalate---CoA ligase
MTAETFGDGVARLHSEILRIWSRLLEISDLSIDDDFFDKGGDSLLATELMLELRKLTGKAIPDSLLFESSTVRALAQRLSEKETPRAKVAVRVGAASDGATPLLFFHGDWTSGGFYVEHLARKLGPEVSLIAIAPHGAGDEPIPPSIEAMAADRLPAILEAQPKGPYRLAGHCVGGIVAFETARLLMRLNHRVEVAMIDSPLMVRGEALKSPRWTSGGGDAGAHGPAAAPDDIPIRPPTPFGRGFEIYTERLAAYSPTPLPVRLLVLASEYDGRDWVRLSGDAELVEIPGDHFDLVTVRIKDLASKLRSWLSGDVSVGLSERDPLAPAWKDQISYAGSSKRELQQSPVRNDEDKALGSAMSNKEIQASQIGPKKNEPVLRRLRRFFNCARAVQ